MCPIKQKEMVHLFLNGYKQEVIFVFFFSFFLKSVPSGQIRFFLMSQNDVRVSVLILKVFCSYFTTVCVSGFFNEIK